eukprot:6789974-Prorocentrum_lima.AAC.1
MCIRDRKRARGHLARAETEHGASHNHALRWELAKGPPMLPAVAHNPSSSTHRPALPQQNQGLHNCIRKSRVQN